MNFPVRNEKCADPTVQMRRLICAFLVWVSMQKSDEAYWPLACTPSYLPRTVGMYARLSQANSRQVHTLPLTVSAGTRSIRLANSLHSVSFYETFLLTNIN